MDSVGAAAGAAALAPNENTPGCGADVEPKEAAAVVVEACPKPKTAGAAEVVVGVKLKLGATAPTVAAGLLVAPNFKEESVVDVSAAVVVAAV